MIQISRDVEILLVVQPQTYERQPEYESRVNSEANGSPFYHDIRLVAMCTLSKFEWKQ